MAARKKVETVAENMDATSMIDDAKDTKKTNDTIQLPELTDEDEIDVVSVISNVSYKDDKTGDTYEWDKIGHVEQISFGVLKNMWRNYKGYFRNMWIKPTDERVIKKLGLSKLYESYAYLTNEDNYTKDNIDKICKEISTIPPEAKLTIVNMVKTLVRNEKISNAYVIRCLERSLDVELFIYV